MMASPAVPTADLSRPDRRRHPSRVFGYPADDGTMANLHKSLIDIDDEEYRQARDLMRDRLVEAMKHAMHAEIHTNRDRTKRSRSVEVDIVYERREAARHWWAFRACLRRAYTLYQCARVFAHYNHGIEL